MKIPRLSRPKLKVPKIRVPRIKVPDVSVPKVAMPKVRIPKMPSRLSLQRKYYTVNTIGYFLFNQVLPTKRRHMRTPDVHAHLDRVTCGGVGHACLPAHFSLTTWNIEMGYQQEQLQADLHSVKSDVMLLQEVPVFTKESAPMLAEYGTYYAFAPGLFIQQRNAKYAFSHRGQLTLANVVPINAEVIPLPSVETLNPDRAKGRFGRRVALYTCLGTPRGTLGVYNVHLENFSTPPGRRMQLEEIFAHMRRQRDMYVIIAGDLNTVYGRLELMGITRQTGLVQSRTGRTCRLMRLDYVFHSKNMKVTARTVNKKSSDHKPIVADVTLL